MTREQIVDLFTRREVALNERSVDTLIAMYAEDAVVESPMGGTQHGRDAIRDVFNVFFDAFTNAAFTTEDLIIDGDRVAQVITFSAIDNGGLMGTAPSGKLAVVPVVFVCRVADGLIQHERRIYDFTGLLVQVGVLKARPA